MLNDKSSHHVSLKANLLWNILLTISGYVFPLITFPYVTRVLGAESYGLANYLFSIVDYAMLFSSLGVTIVGVRYISQTGQDKIEREKVFNNIVSLHLVFTLVVGLLYILGTHILPEMAEYRVLLIVGGTKLIFNVFLVEWLFQGMQDFKYITLRTLLVRIGYVIGVFLFVHRPEDYDAYFYVTIATVMINALVNWRYAHKYVTYRFCLKKAKEFIFPVFSMGINSILLSFYTTFNVIYLGHCCGNEPVGYFTTATRIYTIILSIISAYNGVFVPYLNGLYAKGDIEGFEQTIEKSIRLVNKLSIPLIFGCILLAPEIIYLVAGPGYEKAILPFQIITIQVFCVGQAQIYENQVLLTYKKFKEIFFCTFISTLLSVIILLSCTYKYEEIAVSYAVALPHILELFMLYLYSKRCITTKFPYKDLLVNMVVSLPIIMISLACRYFIDNSIFVLMIAASLSFVYFLATQCLVIRDATIVNQVETIKSKIKF